MIELRLLAEGASGRNGARRAPAVVGPRSTSASCRRASSCAGGRRRHRRSRWFARRLPVPRALGEGGRPPRAQHRSQNRCGVATRIARAEQTLDIVPELNSRHRRCGVQSDRRHLFPWPFLGGTPARPPPWGEDLHADAGGLARGAGHRRLSRRPRRGTCKARRVINACGAWSPKLAEMIGGRRPDVSDPPRDLLVGAPQAVPRRW